MGRTARTPPRDWTDPRHRLGHTGELEAIEFLHSQGWIVLAHRFRVGHNDLDLVIRRGAMVAFVEVKTRVGGGFGPGRQAIGWRKRRTLTRLAEAWRARHGAPGDTYRFDVVEVVRGGSEAGRVEHLEDAWRPLVLK
ncbi:MAG TPA: YraN family protein [Gemmatimonadales bacterium]|nr:YraN family protein [Gemmatimonadales bacterium]